MKPHTAMFLLFLFIMVIIPSYGIITDMDKIDFYGMLYICGIFEGILLCAAFCFWIQDSENND